MTSEDIRQEMIKKYPQEITINLIRAFDHGFFPCSPEVTVQDYEN